jgi:hypothetical protein
MLNDERSPYERVVYARWYQDLTGIVLQYWYLYAYNDFMNNHEGDWEMVSIELSPDGIPERVGISCHEGGYVRDWDNAPKVGDQPMVYVARGSHGGYFSYQEGGHHVPVVTRQLNLPYLGRWLRPLLRRVRWRVAPDRPPADPICDPAAAAEHLGERVEPEIRILPTTPQPGDNRFWWLNIDARWGSRHTRITGTVGCDSPWGQGVRWYDPIGWMDALWW